MTAEILQSLKPVLEQEQPDIVLVHGDTTTTFAATLAAFYQRIPVGPRRGRPAHRQSTGSPWPEGRPTAN